jgi:molecular chaperone GrpE
MTNPDKQPQPADKSFEDLIAKQAQDGASSGLDSASLREQLEAAVAERDANHDQLLRVQAELENSRKRAVKELSDAREYQSLRLLSDILPCLDNLRRAIEAAETSGNIEDLTQGIQMVSKQFDNVLVAHGAKPIESVGQPFDPNCHQALTQVPSADHEPMTVLQEIERGYTLKDRVIRPSSVIVSCAPASDAASPDASAE